MFFDQPRCRLCHRPAQQHHVIYKQHVRRARGNRRDPAADQENALALCREIHHAQAHTGGLPLTALRDENYAFAVNLLGAGKAYNYLRRRYAGVDLRLDAILKLESSHE